MSDYRSNRYSPSRQVSPPPPRYNPPRPNDRPPFRENHIPYDRDHEYPSQPRSQWRSRSRSPLRRYDSPPPRGRYDSPPRGRYGSPPPRRRYDSPPRSTYRREDSPPRREQRYEEYDVRERVSSKGLEADREQERINARPVGAPKGPAAGTQPWERGRDVAELSRDAPSPASREVIFIGVDEDITEEDMISYVRAEHRAMVDTVKIVHKRFADTGRVNALAFITFASLNEAERFIHDNYPSVLMPALFAHSDPRKVRIDFAAPHVPSGDNGPSTYQQHNGHVPHDGMRDVGTPSKGNRVLLLRQVDPSATDAAVVRRVAEEIARLVARPGQDKAAEAAIDRVVTIVDRAGGWSWGICFVELATPELAFALLPHLISPHTQPSGFRIAGVPVAASFASPASFAPGQAGLLGSEYHVQAGANGGIGSGSGRAEIEWVTYWHQQGGAVQATPSNTKWMPGREVSAELRAFLGPLAGALPNVVPPTDQGVLNNAQLQPIKLGKRKKEEEMMVPISVKNALGGDDDGVPEKDTVLLSRTKGHGIITPHSGRRVANNINKWNTKQTELAKPIASGSANKNFSSVNAVPVTSKGQSSIPPIQTQSNDGAPNATATSSSQEFDYSDLSTLGTTGKCACLLCQRQFKSEDILRKHIAQSDLHKTNLHQSDLVEAGKRRKKAVLEKGASAQSRTSGTPEIDITSTRAGTETETAAEKEYRDRAAERRKAFNQPDKPSWHAVQAMAPVDPKQRRRFDGPGPGQGGAGAGAGEGPVSASTPIPVLAPGTDESNVGNQLLSKMGWKSGSGLGVGEEGRVEPIKVQLFAQRAGLGAGVGVDVGSGGSEQGGGGAFGAMGGRARAGRDMAQARYNSSKSADT